MAAARAKTAAARVEVAKALAELEPLEKRLANLEGTPRPAEYGLSMAELIAEGMKKPERLMTSAEATARSEAERAAAKAASEAAKAASEAVRPARLKLGRAEEALSEALIQEGLQERLASPEVQLRRATLAAMTPQERAAIHKNFSSSRE